MLVQGTESVPVTLRYCTQLIFKRQYQNRIPASRIRYAIGCTRTSRRSQYGIGALRQMRVERCVHCFPPWPGATHRP